MLECPDCDRQMNRAFFYSHENDDIFVEFWCVCGARFEGHVYRVEKEKEHLYPHNTDEEGI